MHPVNLRVTNDQSGTVLDMPATFDDTEWSALQSYLDNADRLLAVQLAREGVPCELSINVSEGHLSNIMTELPSSEQVAALLHRLRPFILQSEPFSYAKTLSLLEKHFHQPYMRSRLKEQRRLFDGRNSQELAIVKSNDIVLNSEATLSKWLNAYEYHQDREKKAHIDSLHRVLPLESSIPIFLSLLGDKVQAILQLASIIAVILGKQASVTMSHRNA
jgi:hypothetical protein